MNNLGKIALGLLALAATLSGGCIRESLPACPPLVVELTVRDRNYSNIDDAVKLGLMERMDEDLPFKSYIHTLYCVIRDEQGTVVAEQHNSPVDNDLASQRIVLPASLPYGRYSVTAWGNLTGEEPLSEDASQADLEADGAATNDVYLASGIVDYRYGQETFTLGMERTKGNLLIRAEGLPDNIDFSAKRIKAVYEWIDTRFVYSQLTDIRTSLDWEVKNDILTQTRMCPSPSYEGSTLSVVFIDKSAVGGQDPDSPHPILKPQDVLITMNRNEITILKYLYEEDDGEGSFKIYVRVNDNWELLHQMEID